VFEQGPVKVEREQEFGQLKSALERVFAPQRIEKFLKQLDKKGVRAREFDKVLDKKLIEAVGPLAPGRSARELYQSLAVSDQGLIREFYLSSIDQVEGELRRRFQKLYTYY
jgi:hypothetical protein